LYKEIVNGGNDCVTEGRARREKTQGGKGRGVAKDAEFYFLSQRYDVRAVN
jgi:hypothetical protein